MIFDEIAETSNLNENERQLLQYMINHIEELPHLSSRELGRRMFTSSTAVLRCIKKMGFANYNDFKLNINSYLRNYTMKEVKVSENDELLELMNKMTGLNEQIIQKTKEQISVNILQKVIEQLDQTTFVDIIANNENAQIAEYASSNLCKIGKMATVYENDNKQISLGMNVPRDHVVIAVSKYGENINMLRAMRTLKKRHISVIAITGQGNETMKAVSDETIYGVLDESVNSFTNLIFTTSVKYIFDLIYAVLFSKHYDSTIKHEEILLKLFERR